MYQKKYHKLIKLVICCCILGCSFSFARTNVSAAVKATVKNGVCTVSGKGKMKQKFEGNKKIKKVVIKKGVTYIPKSAFMNCTKLKSVSIANTVKAIDDCAFGGTGLNKITVPKSVKKIGYFALDSNFKKIKMPGNCEPMRYDNDGADWFFRDIKTVEFTTPLDLNTLNYIQCENVITSVDDPKYKSINGDVYSKNGKTLLGVPYGAKKLEVSNKCTKINFSAFRGRFGGNADYPTVTLRYISFPKNFESFQFDDDAYYEKLDFCYLKTIKISNQNFGKNNVNFIFKHFVLNETILTCLSENDYIYYTNGFLIGDSSGIACSSSDAHVLYGYFGDKEEVVIPECVDIIDDFHGYYDVDVVKKVVLDSGVIEVKDNAFNNITSLEKVVLNDGLNIIGDFAFYRTQLTSIIFPSSIEHIGCGVLCYTSIAELELPGKLILSEGSFDKMYYLKRVKIYEGVTQIPEYAFNHCVELEEVDIPSTVTYVASDAFKDCGKLDLSKVYGQVEENRKHGTETD